jgi:hypothetical protein
MCAKFRKIGGKATSGSKRDGMIVLVRSETKNFDARADGVLDPGLLRNANFLIDSPQSRRRGGMRDTVLSYAEIPTDKLNDQLLGFMDKVGSMVEKLPGNLGEFALDEIELSLEITAKGEVGFLGTGGGIEGSGGIKITLRRKVPKSTE